MIDSVFLTAGDTELDLERVITERLSPLHVSIHATDPEIRADILRNRRGAVSLRWLRVLLDTSPNPQLAPDGFGARIETTHGGEQQVDPFLVDEARHHADHRGALFRPTGCSGTNAPGIERKRILAVTGRR